MGGSNLIKAILFDLDGTLINTNRLIIETFQHVFRTHLSIEVPNEELSKYFGEPLAYTMERYHPENPEFLVKAYQEHNIKIHDQLAEIFEGVEDGIKGLKNYGLKVGIVTSKIRSVANRGLKLFDLYGLMDVIITPEDTEKHKPDREPILKACELLGVDPKEAMMVGDSHNDILSGKNAGCETCLVKYTGVPIEQVIKYNPDYLIDSIVDIINIVKEKVGA